jgi:hypothetical protein
MNEHEARMAFGQIADILRQQELSWIVDAVTATVAQGKPVTRTIEKGRELEAVLRELDIVDELPSTTRRARESRLGTEAYSDREALELLIDAIENGLMKPHELVHDTFTSFNEMKMPLDAITFVSEQPDEDKFSVSEEYARGKLDTVGQLRSVLSDLGTTI